MKEKALIIGGAGFVGYYLIEELSPEYCVFATKLVNEEIVNDNVTVFNLDITNREAVFQLMKDLKPNYIYHLAAQSSVALSWKKADLTANVNIIGSINVLDAAKEYVPNSKILLVGSSEEYGIIDYSKKVSEDTNVNPQNIYAITKATVESIGRLYSQVYNMNIYMTRSFNHFGPRQLPQFVVADFASQVAKIEAGIQDPIIRVGKLSAARDFTDVRDIVKAYRIISNKGTKGEVYNVGSGNAIKISDLLNLILDKSNKNIDVLVDEGKFRPIDIPVIIADVKKLKNLGWQIEYDVNQTIEDCLIYYRKKSSK